MNVIETIYDACPHCEAMRNVKIIREMETVKIRGEDVAYEAEYSLCETCGKDFATMPQMDYCLNASRAVYRERHGIIGPAEIVELRRRYDASQKAFAKILDIGDLTINSYEQGALPSGAHNSLLKLAAIPENFRRLFEANKAALSDRQRAKIGRTLERIEMADVTYPEPPREGLMMLQESEPAYHAADADFTRVLQTAQLLLSYAEEGLYKMAVLKLLFYVDFSYFKRTGHSITGWRYARLPFGPVPDDYKEILCVGEERGFFRLEMDEEEIGERVTLPEDFDADAVKADFSPSEIEMIELAARKLGKEPASRLRELSHEEAGWIETPSASIIPWSYAASLLHGV